MKKFILSALVAATALSPVLASAQEWQGRRGGPGRGDGVPQADRPAPPPRPERSMDSFQRPERPQGGGFDREAFRAQREAARAQAQAGGQTFDRDAFRAQREAARVQAGVQVQRQDTGPRPDRDAWRAQREAQRAQGNGGFRPEPSPAPVPGYQNFRQDRRDDRRDFRQERREDRRDLNQGRVTPEQFRQDRRDDRRDFRDERRDDRRDWNRDPRRGDWNRGGTWNRGSDWNRGQRWNREWRNDRRYDWQGWRGSNRSAYRLPRYYPPRGYNYGYQRFGIGITLGSILFQQNYWINDPWDYRLPPAYGPYRWVRYYNDALLVDIDTGEVVDVIYDIFW
ncbi:RcnB family protein [uncultured Sphingomonas sp.]|uniref:RcnB family protein n=1 Tax=uncultured Sphingomonas sp. TaxID=158754 RepID=UPI0025D9BD97|nr:RcnB family protein [uncultured Sphingomonas sp.]